MKLLRRDFLTTAALTGAAAAIAQSAISAVAAQSTSAESKSPAIQNAIRIGDRFVAWQSSYGSTDPVKCPYRSPKGTATIAVVQGIGPQVRALYQLHKATGATSYKDAADRYAIFVLSTVHNPPKPLSNLTMLRGKKVNANSSAWVYGKSLSPCYEWFVANNPNEDLLDLKADAIYRWLQRHRRDDSFFGVGYAIGKFKDAQFSCDLGEVGTGLVGLYKTQKNPEALTDAKGLAKYFLTEHQTGSARGVWSSELGTWLVGPWPGTGAEHFTAQEYDKVGWGWSCLVVGEFLLELRKVVDDEALQKKIDDRCISAFRWCVDKCQFDDGAHGMFGRDDKWVGQTAAAILLYCKLLEMKLIPDNLRQQYHPKIARSWSWMQEYTTAEKYPEHGYIKVTGQTTTKPPENIMWMMAWTVEALLIGDNVFNSSK